MITPSWVQMILMSPLPRNLLTNDVQNARLMSNTKMLHYQDINVQILRNNMEGVDFFVSI